MILQKNAIGANIRVTIKENGTIVNLTTLTTKNFIIVKPSGTVLTLAASFYTTGSDGILTYGTVSGDLDELGTYTIQASLVFSGTGGYTGRTSIASFLVDDNIS